MEGRCPEDYTSTIGIDFKKKIVKLGESRNIKLQLWDTAGRGGSASSSIAGCVHRSGEVQGNVSVILPRVRCHSVCI